MGDASTATTTLSAYVAEDWAGCLADEASIKLLCSKGMDHARLVVLARLMSTPEKFATAVNDLAGDGGPIPPMDLYMVQDFVRAEPVTPSTVGRPAGLPPPSPLELGKGAPGVSPGTLLSPAAASDASLLSPAPAAAASGVSVAELNETREGTAACIRNANLLGVTTLTVLGAHGHDAAAREAIINKAIAKKATDGGAVLKAIRGGEEKFLEHIEELCQWLADMEVPLMFAVARIRVCVNQAPPWKAGGREYWEKYLMKHAYVFRVRFDQLLHQNAHNKALSSLVKNMGDLDRIDDAVAQMDGLSAQLAALSDGDVCGDLGDVSFRGKCNKCLEDGHVVKDCPHPPEVAMKLRAAFCNGRKSAARKKN